MSTFQYPPIPTNVAAGANRALSNLTGVAINANLVPNADNTLNLGANGTAWNSLYIQTNIYNSAGTLRWDVNNNFLYGSGGTPGVLLATRSLTDGFQVALNWENRTINSDVGATMMSWGTATQVSLSVPLKLLAQSADPGTPVAGMIFYDTDIGKIKMYNGAGWEVVVSA